MLQGTFIVAALLLVLFDLRHPTKGDNLAWTSQWLRRTDWVLLSVIVAAQLDVYPLLKATLSLDGYLPGDASTHALVAMHLFDGGWFPSWSDRYVGGFPLVIHYPVLAWLLLAIPVKFGANATLTTLIVGYGFTLSLPPLSYVVARKNGAYFGSSLAIALGLTWISPHTSFTGGLNAFAGTGLLSQVVCLPFLLLWASSVLGKGTLTRASVYGILCILSHPQIAFVAAILLGWCVATSAERERLKRYIGSQLAALLVGALLYGPGVASMGVPFEWPALPRWMQLGFGPDRLGDWFVDGILLDRERPPILTSAWLASVPLLAWKSRTSQAARGALAASVVVVAMCVVGPTLANCGAVGATLLRVAQPLRAMACVPLVSLGSILVTLELYRDAPLRCLKVLQSACARRRTSTRLQRLWLRPMLVLHVCAATIWLPLAFTMHSSHRWTIALWTAVFAQYPKERPCGVNGPSSSEVAALKQRLRQLKGGRLWFDGRDSDTLRICATTTGFERDAAVPLAPTSGAGAHVGLLHEANFRLMPQEPGLERRAEALGIRFVLVASELPNASAHGFALLETYGPLHLYERASESNYFGLGCVAHSIEGNASILHAHLVRALAEPEGRRRLLDPEYLTTLTVAKGALVANASAVPCPDVTSARVVEIPQGVGNYAANLDTKVALTLVLRATAHRSWTIRVNGNPVTPRLVSPGYYAIDLGPGRHIISAHNRQTGYVLLGLLLSGLLPLALWRLEVATKRKTRPA